MDWFTDGPSQALGKKAGGAFIEAHVKRERLGDRQRQGGRSRAWAHHGMANAPSPKLVDEGGTEGGLALCNGYAHLQCPL